MIEYIKNAFLDFAAYLIGRPNADVHPMRYVTAGALTILGCVLILAFAYLVFSRRVVRWPEDESEEPTEEEDGALKSAEEKKELADSSENASNSNDETCGADNQEETLS